MFTIDLDRFRSTPLVREPFDYLVVPEFVRAEVRQSILASYPSIANPGSFPLERLTYGPGFRTLIAELMSYETRLAFAKKFGLGLRELPTMVTVRGRCGPQDGRIHTDLPGKVITVLVYMNPAWEENGGRLRLLRSPDNLDDVILEVPPLAGTLIAFRRADNSYHGHKPFTGVRRVVQLNWVTRKHLRSLRRHELRERFAGFLKHMLPWHSSREKV